MSLGEFIYTLYSNTLSTLTYYFFALFKNTIYRSPAVKQNHKRITKLSHVIDEQLIPVDNEEIVEEKEDLEDDVDMDSKKMYFNRDEIFGLFKDSRENFAKSLTLKDKVYYFTQISHFQIRKIDKIIKEELEKLILTETDEVFLSILKNIDWSISKEFYIKHFYNCKLLYYKLISAKPIFQKVFYDDNYTYKGKLRIVYDDTLKFLMARSLDENESINIRAECLDTIITYGRKLEREKADDLIKTLGQLYVENKEKTIYTNSQNVHTQGVQRTAVSSLLNLATYHRPTENIDLIYEMVLNKLVEDEDKREKVIKSLKRIIMDPTLFQGFNISQILSIVWQEIERLRKYKAELENRLIEELYDSDETCSSGYFTRIINVLSGYSVHVKIGISPEEELISRVVQSIKNKISKLEFIDKERLSLEIMDEDNDPNSFRMKLKAEAYDEIWNNIIEPNNYIEKIKEEHIKEMINLKLNDFFGK